MSAPTRLQRRAALLEERRALRLRLKAQVAAQRSHPLFVAARARRRKARQRRTIAALVALLLLLLLLRCEQEDPLVEEPVVAVVEPESAPVAKRTRPKKVPRKPKGALEGEVDTSDRDAMAVAATTAPPWLPQFRLQVAARSPRLAACFNGVEKPGALQWSALVHASSGRVSESVIEPAFRGVELNQQQHDCLVAALTEPPFELDEPAPEAAARRVSLIFEF